MFPNRCMKPACRNMDVNRSTKDGFDGRKPHLKTNRS